MSVLRRIAVVSRETKIHDVVQGLAHEVFVADDVTEARDIVETVTPDLTVFDGRTAPHHIREFLDTTNARMSRPLVTVVTALEPSPFSGHDYEHAGVSHVLTGEHSLQHLEAIATQIRNEARRPGDRPAHESHFLNEDAATVSMVGCSKAIRHTLKMVKLVAESQCNTVLVLGETGTGKEIVAKAIHEIRHSDEPFVAINCAALTATLLESELFGHVKGAFTGADRDKMGLLELAKGGTLFLDEISEMPLELQAKLLRVLQERTFRKVGGVKDKTCRATIIASSNRNLKKEVTEKRFRQDLYYRLNICPIMLAPLRSPDRREDVRLLAEYFLKTSSICGAKSKPVVSITKLAIEALHRHDWPGNVRELRNVIERAILFETTDKIGLSSIIIEPTESDDTSSPLFNEGIRDFSLEKAERELIARALHRTGWQKTQAAALLGITRATLYAKVKQYNIQKQTPKQSDICLSAPTPPHVEPVVAG